MHAQHGAADLRDAGELTLRHVNELGTLFRGRVLLEQVEQVHDRVERVMDLMRDGGGQASGNGQLL